MTTLKVGDLIGDITFKKDIGIIIKMDSKTATTFWIIAGNRMRSIVKNEEHLLINHYYFHIKESK